MILTHSVLWSHDGAEAHGTGASVRCSSAPYCNGGFTFVELLMLIAIMAILAAVFLPLLQKTLDVSRTVTCSNQLRQIAATSHAYAQDNNGFMALHQPTNWMTALRPYQGEAFACSLSYWINNNPGSANIAYCPSYDNVRTGGPFPQISRSGWVNATTYNPNFILNVRISSGFGYYVDPRISAIPFPSKCILFAESLSYEPVYRWKGQTEGAEGYCVYYNPRHDYSVNCVKVDGSVFLQPYLPKYADQNVIYYHIGTALNMDLYSWRAWGYDLLYPGKR